MGEGLAEGVLIGRGEAVAQLGMKDPGNFGKKSELPKIPYKDFLELLACPVCHGDVEETVCADGESTRNALSCTGKCKSIYYIEDGIPLMGVRFSGVGDLTDADL